MLSASPPSTVQVRSVLRDFADITKGNASVGVCIGSDEWIRLNPVDEQVNWQLAEKNEADLFSKTVSEWKVMPVEGQSGSDPLIGVSSEGQVSIAVMVKGVGNHKPLDSYIDEETKWIDINRNRWSVNSSFAVISFSDRGRGIPEHLKSKVFGRFALESSTGMDLGLNVISRLVEQYAGYLWFEDRVEGDHSQGAAVNVALSLAND